MSDARNATQVSFEDAIAQDPAAIVLNKRPGLATQGGSGTDVPDISIEVDNLDEVLQRAQRGNFLIEYGPVTEPWGVRRFYVRDPFGRLINILEHTT